MKSHMMSQTREYQCWAHMKARCNDVNHPAYKNYGGRGITVCTRWLNGFEFFFADMGKKPSKGLEIDRIDNDRGYDPGNCRWATRSQNARNKRPKTLGQHGVRFLTAFGKTQCLSEWAREFGHSCALLCYRLRNGWDIEKALRTRPNELAKQFGTASAIKHRKHWVQHDGHRLTLEQACALTGVKPSCAIARICRRNIHPRLACGLPLESSPLNIHIECPQQEST